MNNHIGINKEYSAQVSEKLNGLLSNVQIFYMNVRGFHWNITGKNFFKLHEKFEELYNDLNEKADEIAERVLMLEEKPVHAFSEYLKISEIKEKTSISDEKETMSEVLDGFNVLLKMEREILTYAADNNDDGTADLMTGYIYEQEKLLWMLNAYLK